MKKNLLTPIKRLSITRKWLFTLVFCLTVLFLSLSATANETLLIPEQKTLVTEDTVWYSFTPTTLEESGTYIFRSLGNVDTVGFLYQVSSSGDIVGDIINDDNSGEDDNFKITCNLTLGAEYIFGATLASDATSDSFYVLLSKNDWSFQNEVLTISGSDPMPEYIGGDTPWYEYSDQIVSIIIENGMPNIGSYAFLACEHLKNVTIPSSVTEIGDFAFSNCTSLESISISSGLTSVGYYAFKDCGILDNVTLPNTVTTIYDGAFSGCSKMTSLTVPESVHFTGPYVLENCNELDDYNGYIVLGHVLAGYTGSVQNIESIPSNVRVIGDYAFYGNTKLNSIVLPEGITTIGDFAFATCENLYEISIPASLSSISSSAFTGCINLNTGDSEDFLILGSILYRYTGSSAAVTIPDGVTKIGISAFDGNNVITSVTIPSGLTAIGDYAFRGCSSLKKIIGPSGSSTVTHYHYNRYDGLYAIELPSTVQTCGENSFTGTALGQSIQPNFVLPENYNSELVIEEEAFSGIAATYVFVPASVSRISSGTFAGCTELRFIYFSNPDCVIADDAFTGCDSSLTFICQEEGGTSSVHHFADAHHFRFIEDAEETIDE